MGRVSESRQVVKGVSPTGMWLCAGRICFHNQPLSDRAENSNSQAEV